MKVVFFGGTRRGHMALEALIQAGAEVCGVVSLEQDAHEIGRFEEPIRALAAAHNIPHVQTKWMKDRDYRALIAGWNPEIGLVVGCRILLPRDIYTLPAQGTLAIHDSLLPEYRGFAPLNWALINGEDHTGVSLFYLTEGTDEGDIVDQIRVPIQSYETASQVYDSVCAASVELIRRAWPQLAAGTAPRVSQMHRDASFTSSRIPDDGEIDWSRPAVQIYNLVRGLSYPYPGAYTFWHGRQITIWTARPLAIPKRYPGRVPGRPVHVARETGEVHVLTGDGILELLEVQLTGEPTKPAAEVVNSVRAQLGLSRSALLRRIEALEQRFAAHKLP